MEQIYKEVQVLSKTILQQWIFFTDKKILKRVIELKNHFSDDIIMIVTERINDPRTNAEIKSILEAEMQKWKN